MVICMSDWDMIREFKLKGRNTSNSEDERHYMVTLWPRPDDFVGLGNTNISVENV